MVSLDNPEKASQSGIVNHAEHLLADAYSWTSRHPTITTVAAGAIAIAGAAALSPGFRTAIKAMTGELSKGIQLCNLERNVTQAVDVAELPRQSGFDAVVRRLGGTEYTLGGSYALEIQGAARRAAQDLDIAVPLGRFQMADGKLNAPALFQDLKAHLQTPIGDGIKLTVDPTAVTKPANRFLKSPGGISFAVEARDEAAQSRRFVVDVWVKPPSVYPTKSALFDSSYGASLRPVNVVEPGAVALDKIDRLGRFTRSWKHDKDIKDVSNIVDWLLADMKRFEALGEKMGRKPDGIGILDC
jgi:hypothetical protein